jgi:GTP cyclohydrolase FolE2
VFGELDHHQQGMMYWVNTTVDIHTLCLCSMSMVPKVCSMVPLGSVAHSQWMCGFISVMATVKCDVLLQIIMELL